MNLENECPKQGNALQDESFHAHHKQGMILVTPFFVLKLIIKNFSSPQIAHFSLSKI